MRFIKTTAMTGLISFVFTLFFNCYGNFGLTKFIYKFNGEIGGKFGLSGVAERLVNTIAMWIMAIIPVYGLAMLVDAIGLNLIEFWTGKPINIGHNDPIKFKSEDGSQVELSYLDKGNTMMIHIKSQQHGSTTHYVFKDKPGKFFNKINDAYVEIEFNKKEKDLNTYEIVINDGTGVKTVTVEKTKFFAFQNRVFKLYEVAMAKHQNTAVASVPAEIY